MGKRVKTAYLYSYRLAPERQPVYFNCIADLLNTSEVQSMACYEQHFEINRLQHMRSVSYLSFLACRKLGLDFRLAARGGILHDLFYYDWREKDPSHRFHGYVHPAFALKNARELCGPLDRKTENIILRHMWPLTPTPPRCAEAFVVSMADKYCAAQEILISFHKGYRARFYAVLESGGKENG